MFSTGVWFIGDIIWCIWAEIRNLLAANCIKLSSEGYFAAQKLNLGVDIIIPIEKKLENLEKTAFTVRPWE